MADRATKLQNHFRPTPDLVCSGIERFPDLNLLSCCSGHFRWQMR